ncbi:MAG: hypothetical protein AAFX51_14420 [Cyanobacteria bacterium J06636_28]
MHQDICYTLAGANPRYPLIQDLKTLYIAAYRDGLVVPLSAAAMEEVAR